MARRREGRRTDYTWQDSQLALLAVAAGTPTAGQIFSVNLSSTLVRVRGEVLAWLDATPAAGDAVVVGCGMRVAPNGAGNTVIIDPLSDGDGDWFWYELMTLAFDGTDVNGVTAAKRIEIDGKAMRRVKQAEEIQFVMNQLTIGTAQAVNVSVNVRALFGA